MCYHVSQQNNDRLELESLFDAYLNFDIIPTYHHVNGFQRPTMMIITENEPNKIQLGTWSVAPPDCENVASYWKEKGGSVLNTRDDSLFTFKSAHWKSDAMLENKCIVLVTGFFEPHKVGKESYPFMLYEPNNEVFGLCGYYVNQGDYLTFSIVTNTANEYMAKVHNGAKRMPMTISADEKESYFELNTIEDLQRVFSSKYCIPLEHKAVDRAVLNSRIDSNYPEITNEVNHPIIFDFD